MKHTMRLYAGLSMLLFAAACGSSPSEPSTPPTVSLSAPVSVGPTDHARIGNPEQPITLTIQNAVATQTGATTYTFEVATDSAFASKVQTKDNVPEGAGQTSVRLDPLPPDKDYFWHARAQRGGVVGVFSSTFSFSIGPAIVLLAPSPIAPLNGTQATMSRPTFTVSNATRTGPAGSISYKFEIATNSGFSPVAITGTVAEGSGQTSFTPTTELAPSVSYFWRATAIDQGSSVSSAPSATQTFNSQVKTAQSDLAAQLNITLWPGAQPAGSTGHSQLGDNWQVQTLFHAPTRTTFLSPTIEELRLFDLMDRGLTPQGAIDFLTANRYPTTAQYYPGIEVIGVPFTYMAYINGRWDLVLRAE